MGAQAQKLWRILCSRKKTSDYFLFGAALIVSGGVDLMGVLTNVRHLGGDGFLTGPTTPRMTVIVAGGDPSPFGGILSATGPHPSYRVRTERSTNTRQKDSLLHLASLFAGIHFSGSLNGAARPHCQVIRKCVSNKNQAHEEPPLFNPSPGVIP